MNEDGIFSVMVTLVSIAILSIGIYIGMSFSHQPTMKEAFNRGYAVQCLGKIGYYWECEE